VSTLDRFQVEDLLREAARRSPTRAARAWRESGADALGLDVRRSPRPISTSDTLRCEGKHER
jgi:hypothetical protein